MIPFEQELNRLVYIFNVVDTYVPIAAAFVTLALCLAFKRKLRLENFAWLIVISVMFSHVRYLPLTLLFIPLCPFLFKSAGNTIRLAIVLVLNSVFFFVTQFFLYSIPYVILIPDITIPLRIAWNSIWTICPSSSSAPICVGYATILTIFSTCPVMPKTSHVKTLLILIVFCASNFLIMPVNEIPLNPGRPTNPNPVENIIYVEIHGLRYDKFLQADTPYLDSLTRIFTNARPTFIGMTDSVMTSFLTGAPPEVHGIRDNNYQGEIPLDALPDTVKTRLYSNIHLQDVAKPSWNITVFSLPEYKIKKYDDAIVGTFLKDYANKEARLYVVDFSTVDLIGHAYGSDSWQYIRAIEDTDRRIRRIGDVIDWNNTVLIVSSWHSFAGMDHGFLLQESDKHIPLIIAGKGITPKGIQEPAITDYAPTISYLLGTRYPDNATGRVLLLQQLTK